MAVNSYLRQCSKWIVEAITPGNIGNNITAQLPSGAQIVNVLLECDEAFNSTGGDGTLTATVTDGTTVFANAQSLKSTGSKTVAVSVKYFPNGGTITASLAESATTTATAGHAVLAIEYVVEGTGTSVYG